LRLVAVLDLLGFATGSALVDSIRFKTTLVRELIRANLIVTSAVTGGGTADSSNRSWFLDALRARLAL
jgi:hypothetical protein